MPSIDLGQVVGPTGATGPQGPQGIQGNPGPNQITSATSTTLNGVLAGSNGVVGVRAVDSNPTGLSTNLVESGGVKSALDNLKSTAVNPNLLINWDFGNPVNQRGITQGFNIDDITIDRWKLTSGTMSVVSGGIVLNGTLVQTRMRSIGRQVVASALTLDGALLTPTYDDSAKTFTITATGQTIVAAKLELGSAQTLAHQDPNGNYVLNAVANYDDELEKCKLHYQVIKAGVSNLTIAVGCASTTNDIYANIKLHPMAQLPISVGYSDVKYGTDSLGGSVTQFILFALDNASGFATVRCYIQTGGLTTGSFYRVGLAQNGGKVTFATGL